MSITIQKRDIIRFDVSVINPGYTKYTAANGGGYWDYLCPKSFKIEGDSNSPLEMMSILTLGFPVSSQISNAFLTYNDGVSNITISGITGVGVLSDYVSIISSTGYQNLLSKFGSETTIANTISGVNSGTIPQFSIYNVSPIYRSYGMFLIPSYVDGATGNDVTSSNITTTNFKPVFSAGSSLVANKTITITLDVVTDDTTIMLPTQLGISYGIIECICYPSPFYQVTWYSYKLSGGVFLPC